MVIGGIIVVCVLLLVLAFVAPRLSRHPQNAVNKSLGQSGRAAGKAPGFLGRWLQKPFHKSQKATSKSGAAGRNARSKLPL